MKKLFLFLLSLMLIFTLAACESEDEQVSEEQQNEAVTEDDTGEDSKSEKPFEGTTLELMVAYGGADDSFDTFTRETGIEIDWVSISTGAALSKLQAEEGETTADVWFGGGVDSYLNARKFGYLYQYESPELSAIDPTYIDPEGHFGALSLVPAGFIVNNELLEQLDLEAPRTWEDLADPKYDGEIIMADPSISGTQYAILSGLIQALGEEEAWEYWSEVDQNIDFYAQSGGEPQQKVAAGEFAIGVTAIHGRTFNLEETAPTTAIFPEDYVPWTPSPIAIFENTENPEAAKELVDWYLSYEGQNVLKEADARIMAREDVEPPQEMEEFDRGRLIDFDLERMGREREDILDEWKELIGEH